MSASNILMQLDAFGFLMAKQLLSLTWQFLLLFAAATIMLIVLKRASAHIRHRVWSLLFFSLPVIMLLVYTADHIGAPQVQVPVLPAYETVSVLDTEPISRPFPQVQAPEPVVTKPKSLFEYPWSILCAMYVVGASGFLMLVGFGRLRLERYQHRGQVVADVRVSEAFLSARAYLGIKRAIGLIETDYVRAPLTMGTVHPVVLMPIGFAGELSDTELKAFALHELAHVKRFDSLLLMYVGIIRSLLFFNPLVWYAARQVSIIAENACDDIVVESERTPLDYATMLVRLARNLPRHELQTELAAGFIITKHHFLRRVEQILADRKGRMTKLSKRALAGCLILGAAVVTLIVTVPIAEVQELADVERITDRPAQEIVDEVYANLSADPTTTITGRVFDPEGNPVAGATVAPSLTGSHQADIGGTRHDVMTDDEGYYEIALPPSKSFEFNLVAHDGDIMSVRTWANGVSRSFKTTDGQKIENMDITLTRPGAIRGIVVDLEGNTMAGQEVKALTSDGYSNTLYEPTTETDEQGRFEIAHVRPGQVVVSTTSVKPASILTGRELEELMRTVTVNSGQTVGNIRLIGYEGGALPEKMKPSGEEYNGNSGELIPKTATFRARVIDTNGEPVANLRMLYLNTNEMINGIEFTSDSNGQVSLTGVARGTASFFAYLDNDIYQRWWSKDSVQSEELKGVDLRSRWSSKDIVPVEGSGNNGNDFAMAITRFTYPTTNPLAFEVTENMEPVTIYVHTTMYVRGNVYDPVGNPIEGATIAPVETGSGNFIAGDTGFSVQTNRQGQYSMNLPDSGGLDYNLVAHDGDFTEQRIWANGVSRPIKSTTGDYVSGFDITLTRPGTISGIVVDSSGEPMVGKRVIVTAVDGFSNRYYEPEGITDEQGRFEITHIRPGEIWVMSPPSLIEDEHTANAVSEEMYQKVTVKAGQTVDNIRLVQNGGGALPDDMESPVDQYFDRSGERTPKTGTFRARVIDDTTGEPFPGLRMRYYTSDDQTSSIEFSADRNGEIEFPGVKQGDAQFGAFFEDGAGGWYSKDSVQIDGPIDYGNFVGTVTTRLTKPSNNPMAFEVTENMEPVTIRVQTTMIITGSVYDPDGNPVAGATVAPARTGTGNSITGDTRFSVMTDETGRYTMYLPDSEGREYNLVAHDGDYMEERTWANGVTAPMKSKTGDRLDGLDIVLTRPASISGIVIDTDGNPKAGEIVKVAACDGLSNRYYEPEVVTDEQGRFEINHIRPGDIYVVAGRVAISDKRSRESLPEEMYQNVPAIAGRTVENVELVYYTMDELNARRKPAGWLMQIMRKIF